MRGSTFVRTANVQDLKALYPVIRHEKPDTFEEFLLDIEYKAALGSAYILMSPEGPIAVAGIAKIRNGVGNAWVFGSPRIINYPKFMFSACKKELDNCMEFELFHRIETTCSAGFYTAQGFLERLGFKQEGLCRKWSSHKEDYYIYGMVK